MLSLILLEYRKLFGARSARFALAVCALLPFLWSFAPGLQDVYNLVLVSAWQVPALAMLTAAQFLLPLFISITCAEMIGTEIAQGTLAPLLLRPLNRSKVILAKLVAALTYPAILLATLLLFGLIAGARFGFMDFAGGTGLTPAGFVGAGVTTTATALMETLRGFGIAALTLMPIAALAVLFGILYLNTAAAALATIATLQVMRLLIVFPKAFQKILLTTHLDAYLRAAPAESLVLLMIYTVGFSLLALFIFERKDV
ncbi:ABC transporter permease [Deinococcus maricopensis]|uniref:Putative ABC-2 type transport system permease protein n=1 Tax=Deinococcus maricopensis (strain DSM 21211 / LMG 22137 / NRRL B-23946 / LB-34) TaxID=709986 RepID=E8U5R0_DEIML|nr:ABC transporter permease [Deinococcus maricopensis]ADV66399.1 putative ABC-2 type transport system permease protein [Deinococcus maricopensis DSM 21211]